VAGATGMAVEFLPHPADPNGANHYHVRELQAFAENDVKLAIEYPVIGIDVFDASNPAIDRKRPPSQGQPVAWAYDDNPYTYSGLTPSGNTADVIAAFELESGAPVDRIRVGKFAVDVDGHGGADDIDIMDLEVLFSSDSGPLNQRAYHPVSGMVNGFMGNELINGTVFPDGRIENDVHDPAWDGGADSNFWSVQFDPVRATALALRIRRDPSDDASWLHYPLAEMQVFYTIPEPSSLTLLAIGFLASVGAGLRRRR